MKPFMRTAPTMLNLPSVIDRLAASVMSGECSVTVSASTKYDELSIVNTSLVSPSAVALVVSSVYSPKKSYIRPPPEPPSP